MCIRDRAYDDLTETYDLCQSRWINSGLYITDDGWQTVKAAIGKYIYVNPETGNEVTTMGVIGDTIAVSYTHLSMDARK